MMVKNVCSLVFIMLIGAAQIFAQDSPKFVNEFLNIGVGARAHGMSGSVVASTHDVTAGFWNPAGLASMESDFEAAAMHASWFGGIANYDSIGFGAKMGDWQKPSYGSISIIRMGIDNIPNTINLIGPDGTINYDNVTEFSAADYAMLASYAMNLGPDGLSVGATAKVIYRRIGSFGRAWGIGFDAGALYKKERFTLGLMLRDITTTVNAWSFSLTEQEKAVFQATGNVVPVSSTEIALPKVSLAGTFHGEIDKFSYLVELDARFSSDGTEAGVLSTDRFALDPSLGVELGYNSLAFLRFGLGNFQRTLNAANTDTSDLSFMPNAGIGINLGKVKVDYALANFGNTSEVLVSHIVSARVEF